MDSSSDPNLQDLLAKLQQKYAVMGQDMSSYLDGLLHADYLTYWDYIHLDTLLSLQNPKTRFPDERVFIIYHQITELYFNLILWEIEQIVSNPSLNKTFLVTRLDRINRYFKHLSDSFDIMTEGMERDQFLKFRMSLLPASGFQSAQYRMIEMASTDLINLVDVNYRLSLAGSSVQEQVEKLYWRSGATELASGKKTLTLQQFEEKYIAQFLDMGERYRNKNLLRLYLHHFAGDQDVIARFREFDALANVYWPLAHMRSAGRYLHKDPEDIKATGGTNWQKYLPPRFQKIIFFPDIWSDQEKSEWGKAGVERALQSGR
ncbi:MAG TPA: tryptophan 2,3-dioxygenase family protein [Cyclobacteriaceae bacterium]|nr:tryptophan 2,3-dioxygenase family protein [Cyclobacteriaceae bacterium]